MEEITISNLDEGIVRQLKQQASEDGVALEVALKRILIDAARVSKTHRLDPHFPAPTD
jgi:plasmid stability protein